MLLVMLSNIVGSAEFLVDLDCTFSQFVVAFSSPKLMNEVLLYFLVCYNATSYLMKSTSCFICVSEGLRWTESIKWNLHLSVYSWGHIISMLSNLPLTGLHTHVQLIQNIKYKCFEVSNNNMCCSMKLKGTDDEGRTQDNPLYTCFCLSLQAILTLQAIVASFAWMTTPGSPP